ncbi:hypothetical protein [Ancylobacter polymorphus]|uniref:Transcriptional regulator with XRE-family HTH domain n=1 Tax=Ancylobacter polymorphus TaxID=223390 RepID=A0ABU0BJV3_9HYPH|nr:hypothetical protein [Ancylobacter polymorphus]MDQ0305302.1 transcriptional regulator with XRE-family HTH domain [Ancylobacter polymorphus]
MVTSIGGARPPRLYIEEWMATVPGLDRKRLAERMGVSPGTISKKLKKPGHIDAEWMEKFRHALNLPSVADLFRDPSAPTQADLLQGLTPEQKNEVADFAAFVRQRAAG